MTHPCGCPIAPDNYLDRCVHGNVSIVIDASVPTAYMAQPLDCIHDGVECERPCPCWCQPCIDGDVEVEG